MKGVDIKKHLEAGKAVRTPWAHAHRKQRPQEKVKLHPHGGKRK
jgi:hypothetical protein